VILHTPGHSQDSISVVLADGSAFLGDAAMNFMRFFGTRYRQICAEDYESVRELAQADETRSKRHLYCPRGDIQRR
jgi:glyoxylase-like metal-dependent hydrolase (beta-lactamase superfamily II)